MQRIEVTQPSPPDGPGRSGRRAWRAGAAALLLLALGAAALLVPIPIFYAYLPGPVRDVERMVRVSGERTYPSEGRLLLTTVSVDVNVTFFELLLAVGNPHRSVVFKDDVTGGASLRRLQRSQRREMQESKQHAREVAFAALGLGRPHGDGARVIATQRDAPARRVLEPGDVIVAINGHAVETTCDVGRVVERLTVGARATLIVRRDGQRKPLHVRVASNPQDRGSGFIGVAMTDVDYRFDPGVDVDFDTGRIAGPSAGLMFSLALYDRLTADDLTAGREIAGTGTIACDGGVGPIGGVEQKVAAAEASGAEVFLSPVANAPAAERAADALEVVAVSTFAEAVEYLEPPG